MNTPANWKSRYSNDKRMVPFPNGKDDLLRHIKEHGWSSKDQSKTLQLSFKQISKMHDRIHGWHSIHQQIDPQAYFRPSYRALVNDIIHDHPHPESGKPVTNFKVIESYSDE